MTERKDKNIRLLTHVTTENAEDHLKPLDFGLITRLFRYTRHCAPRRNRLFALVILRAMLLPSLAWAIGAVIGGPVSQMDVRGALLGTAGFAALSALTHYSFRYRMLLSQQIGEQVIHDLRNEMFAHLQTMTMRFFNSTKVGRIITRFTSDTESMRNGVQNSLFISMVAGGQMVFSAMFMIHYDRVLFLVILAMTPFIWMISRFFHRRLSTCYRAASESFSRITGNLAESMAGMRVTQAFAREDINAGLFSELLGDHVRYNLRAGATAGVFFSILEAIAQLFIALITIVGGYRVLHGYAHVEALYQFLLISGVFFGPIQVLASQYDGAMSAMAGAERVFRFLDTPPDWSDAADAQTLPELEGGIEFRNVTFSYDPLRPVLHEISFSAPPRRIVALVGHTGSGKSSIINLLAKFYLADSGQVLLDGHDIRQLHSDWLHSQMGIVLQQNFLFSGTVLDNIMLGKDGSTPAQAIAAAELLDCRDIMEAMPSGFQTEVGEGGAGVSLGQRQLICFARAMLADPRILILDEATSAVDTLTEARIQRALARLLNNRTSVVVAHRLSTVRNADQVLVLDEGRIIERGTHRELLLARGAYTRMYRKFVRPMSKGC